MILQSLSFWFHPSLYLLTPCSSYHPFRWCSHSLIHLLPLSLLLLLIHLLLIFYVSLRHVISLSISYLLPVHSCSFRFNNISTPSFHFDILHSLHLPAASMNVSLVSIPYIYLFLIWISVSFSPRMPICVYLRWLPVSVGSALTRDGAEGGMN